MQCSIVMYKEHLTSLPGVIHTLRLRTFYVAIFPKCTGSDVKSLSLTHLPSFDELLIEYKDKEKAFSCRNSQN